MATVDNPVIRSSSAAIENSDKSGNICHRGIAPAILTTLANLIGLVALNILQQHYLSIMFGVGTLGGAYTIYQVHRTRLLKSLQENHVILQASIAAMKQEISTYKLELDKTENVLVDMEKQRQQLQAITDLQKAEISKLQGHVEKLTQETEKLNKVKDDLEKNAQDHIEKLHSLTASLKGVEEAVLANHQLFAEKVVAFREEVMSIKQVSCNIDASVKIFGNQFDQLSAFGQKLERIFSQIEKWKNLGSVSEHIALLQQLNQRVLELTRTIAAGEGRAEAIRNEIHDLQVLETQFRGLLASLKVELERMEDILRQKRAFVAAVKELIHEMNNLPTGCQLPPRILALIQSM